MTLFTLSQLHIVYLALQGLAFVNLILPLLINLERRLAHVLSSI